eukprot:CAMPEP_0115341356 /NCGR_PEP_ID=MMETSP0270-20121206/91631_1 /TAXON_ID=71861 /ORGANISM="Scrippsiella trochoidea, Strain CCMP3099" /LENGTH=108 /DNA_ID=CAMNT_0002762861 /DNA_START=30 /DNA_END=356 /DNA_ORIENTATION=+
MALREARRCRICKRRMGFIWARKGFCGQESFCYVSPPSAMVTPASVCSQEYSEQGIDGKEQHTPPQHKDSAHSNGLADAAPSLRVLSECLTQAAAARAFGGVGPPDRR